MATLMLTTSYAALAQWNPPPPPPPYPGHPFNITVYHVNEGSYGAAPIDMNTADLQGDMFFDLRSKPLAMECSAPHPSGHDCTNQEVNPPADDPLVVTKLVLTIASPWGPYGRCNVCVNHTDGHGSYNCTNGQYICECGSYGHSSSGCGTAPGYENVHSHFGTRSCRQGDPNYACWKDATAAKVTSPETGLWYSTTRAGYGTTWKVAQVVKRIAKSCSDDSINAAVERAAAAGGCFQKCGPHSTGPTRNTSDTCWITCFEQTVLGPDSGRAGGTVAGMPLATLEQAWSAPFESEEPAKFGCPALPTGPIPPLPRGSPLAHLPGAEPRQQQPPPPSR